MMAVLKELGANKPLPPSKCKAKSKTKSWAAAAAVTSPPPTAANVDANADAVGGDARWVKNNARAFVPLTLPPPHRPPPPLTTITAITNNTNIDMWPRHCPPSSTDGSGGSTSALSVRVHATQVGRSHRIYSYDADVPPSVIYA